MKIVAIGFSAESAALINVLRLRLRATADEEGKGVLDVEGYCKTAEGSFGLRAIEGETSDLVANCFAERHPILFVSSCGIAVRLISPYVRDKMHDVPVLVMDEAGRFVIPILSGHVGRANVLAELISGIVSAVPIVTTATDLHHAFAADNFAIEERLTIQNKEAIKRVSAKALSGEPVRICVEKFPPTPDTDIVIADEWLCEESQLWLSPKKYVLGIGCKKGKTVEDIELAVAPALKKAGIAYTDIHAFGSVDLKAEEPCFLDFARKHRIPFVSFSAEVLKEVQGEFSASEFVEETTGVDNVCERAAMLLTRGCGRLVIPKTAMDGVTVAVAQRYGV